MLAGWGAGVVQRRGPQVVAQRIHDLKEHVEVRSGSELLGLNWDGRLLRAAPIAPAMVATFAGNQILMNVVAHINSNLASIPLSSR